MNTTESMALTMRLMASSLTAQSSKTSETDSAASQPSSGTGRDFKTMLKQKSGQTDRTGKVTQKSQSSVSTDDKTTSDKKTDQVCQEVAAILTAFAQNTAPALIQTQPSTQQAVNQVALVQNQSGEVQTTAEEALPALTDAVSNTLPESAAVSGSIAAGNQSNEPLVQLKVPTQADPQVVQQGAASVETETVQPAQNAQNGTAADTGENAGTNVTQQDKKDDGVQMLYSETNTNRTLFRNVEATPVKVGELPTADTQSQNLDAQLADQISETLNSGAQHLEIRLTPENLGTVTVDLTRGQDGTLQVVLHTTTEKAADLLARHTGTLGSLLQSSNQSTVQVEVRPQETSQQFQQNDQGQHNGQNAYQQQQQRRQQSEDFLQQLRLGIVSLEDAVS